MLYVVSFQYFNSVGYYYFYFYYYYYYFYFPTSLEISLSNFKAALGGKEKWKGTVVEERGDVSGWRWQVQQRPGNEIGVENFMNPFEMTGSQSEAGNHYILRSLPPRSTGTCL